MILRQRGFLLGLLILAISAGVATSAHAVPVPRVIFYQGRITNDTGQALNGNYSMDFTLYNASSGGVSFWTENQSSVSVQNGIFSVYLGSSSALPDTIFDTAIWMATGVSGNTFSPRTRLAAAPYAYNAYRLDNLDSTKIAKVAGDTFTGVVAAETIVARTAGGLFLRDDGGNLGVYIQDGGKVAIGTTTIDAQVMQLSGSYDQLVIAESDGTTDNKKWLFKANTRFLDILVGDDAWTSWATGFGIGRRDVNVDTVYFPNGNVLIGGSTNKLNTKVAIVSTADHLMIWDSDGTTDNAKWTHKADGNWYELITSDDAWSSWAAAIRLGRNGINVDTIAFPNGNFGIGSSAPKNKFHVDGGATIRDTFAVGNTYGDSLLVNQRGVGIGTTSPGYGHRLDVRGHILAQGVEGYDATNERGNIYLGDSNSFVSAVYSSGMHLSAYLAVDSFVMKEITGNVGIGIVDPRFKLEVLTGKSGGVFIGEDSSWSTGDTAALFFGDGNAKILNDWDGNFIVDANKTVDFRNGADTYLRMSTTNIRTDVPLAADSGVRGPYTISVIHIYGRDQGELSGYVYTNTIADAFSWSDFVINGRWWHPDGKIQVNLMFRGRRDAGASGQDCYTAYEIGGTYASYYLHWSASYNWYEVGWSNYTLTTATSGTIQKYGTGATCASSHAYLLVKPQD